MMKNWPKWACEHAQITKTGLSDGYGGETFPMMVRIGYDHHGYDDYLGNTGRERPDELFLLIWPLDSAACWSARSCAAPRSRIATAPRSFSPRSAPPSPGYATSSRTAPTPARNSKMRSSGWANRPLKSSSDPRPQKASKSCRADGSSSARWLGSTATDAWPRTSRQPSQARKPGSTSPAFNSSCADWEGFEKPHIISSQTLRLDVCPR